jgi:hypothetical protein
MKLLKGFSPNLFAVNFTEVLGLAHTLIPMINLCSGDSTTIATERKKSCILTSLTDSLKLRLSVTNFTTGSWLVAGGRFGAMRSRRTPRH